MTTDEQKRVQVLCEQMATEEDARKVFELLLELNNLLERKAPGLEKGADCLENGPTR